MRLYGMVTVTAPVTCEMGVPALVCMEWKKIELLKGIKKAHCSEGSNTKYRIHIKV